MVLLTWTPHLKEEEEGVYQVTLLSSQHSNGCSDGDEGVYQVTILSQHSNGCSDGDSEVAVLHSDKYSFETNVSWYN
jgi:hypothetical protein